MAQRRMFSPKIVASDAFLEMPTSSRELYFQLGMYADDDGFVNPRKIVRMIGASEDDLKVLIAKRFVIPFENGVVVIKHWAINNLIRKDWYQETIYQEQKKLLKTKENGAYTELVNETVNNSATEVSLGKDRLGKFSTEERDAILQIATPSSESKDFFSSKEKQESIISFLVENKVSEPIARKEVEKFILYWTEPSSTGKKQRWQMEKTFDVRRRFVRWMSNAGTFGRRNNEKKGITL